MSGARDLGGALREANWEVLLPRLVEHAGWRLRRIGWAAGEHREPSAMTVQQVVNTAVERCLMGRTRWTERCPSLEVLLKGVVDNVVWNAKRSSVRDKADAVADAGVDTADDRQSAEDALAAEQGRAAICSAVEACVEDDPKLRKLYLAILDGHVKRDEIALALNWSTEEVSAAKVKLKRRLLSKFPEISVSKKGGTP